jgi:hypothetical protein
MLVHPSSKTMPEINDALRSCSRRFRLSRRRLLDELGASRLYNLHLLLE